MHVKFASLAHPEKFGYAFDSEAYDYKTSHPSHDHFRMFETYNDGLTQHSHDWTVDRDHLADFLYSLAAQCMENGELAEKVYHAVSHRPCEENIAFAASVIYKEGKRRYFSVSERKVSSSESKEHDKRYEQIRDIHDGSGKSMFRILISEYANGMDALGTAYAIREYLLKNEKWMPLAADFLEWYKDRADEREMCQSLNRAFETIGYICESHRLRLNTESSVDGYRRNLRYQAEAKSAEVIPELAS